MIAGSMPLREAHSIVKTRNALFALHDVLRMRCSDTPCGCQVLWVSCLVQCRYRQAITFDSVPHQCSVILIYVGFQTCTVLSLLPEAMDTPLGDHASVLTAALLPLVKWPM